MQQQNNSNKKKLTKAQKKAAAREKQVQDRNDHSNIQALSMNLSPEEKRAAENRAKVENLCELFPHVACDEISDVFSQCDHNI